jgi:hypothetical protein
LQVLIRLEQELGLVLGQVLEQVLEQGRVLEIKEG